MYNPIKVIYKFKNVNRRNQYYIFIFVGFLVTKDIKKILSKIQDLNFYDSLIELNINEKNKLEDVYNKKWYNSFFTTEHLKNQIKEISINDTKSNKIKKKFGNEWYQENINMKNLKGKLKYSYQYLFKKEKEKRDRKRILREKGLMDENDYLTNFQSGGDDNIDKPNDLDANKFIDDNNVIDDNVEYDEVDEFDLDELQNMYQTVEIDKNIEKTTELIDKVIKKDEKKKSSSIELLNFPTDKNNIMYDEDLKNVYKKYYVYNQQIFKDDSIKKIKEKICCSIKLNSMFTNNKHSGYLTPNKLYLWSKYNYIDQIDGKEKINKIMIGQKWIKRNEILKIDVEPNDNIRIYEEIRGNLENLRQDMTKYGSRIKREEDNLKLLEDYNEYIENNEIYMIDILHELGLNYNVSDEKIKNLYNIYVKIYFFHINSEDLKQIINYLNINNEELRIYEINFMKNIFQTLNNDLKIENEIIKTIEDVDINKTEIKNMFSDNYITHSVIHTYVSHTNTFGSPVIDLFRIFDNFIMTEEFPFLQYQLMDGKMVYKLYTKTMEEQKIVTAKWFENAPYGISFKIRAEQKGDYYNKFIAVSLNDNGRLEYKIQWKEDDKANIDDVKNTFYYVRNLISKINGENKKIKIFSPDDDDFNFAFINSIQKFTFDGKRSINHNDFSNFSRYFYPYVSLVVEPKKRTSKMSLLSEKGKFGTYLRYKRVSKYENEAKIEQRILYFMKNYEYNEISLIKEIGKQFNLTDIQASDKIESVRKKYPVIKKSRKILKKIDSAPKYNQPGIGIDIQGKSRSNYKIRVSGARNKYHVFRITSLMKKIIYLYVKTYIENKNEYQDIKKKLKELTNIAKRRNKVDDIVDIEDQEIKNVKRITKLDKNRLGYRPEQGENHWTRACQNSGVKKRQPQQYLYSSLDELLKKGYTYNEKSGFYERKVKVKGKEIVLKAAELSNMDERGNNLFYICDPKENNDYMYIGFLSRSKNPNDLCMPCCFKKNQLYSDNKRKQNYFLKCMGKMEKVDENKDKKLKTDKIYILQDTNKIQEDRFGFLPEMLDLFLNKKQNYQAKITSHILKKTKPYYYFKYGVRTSNYPFLEAIGHIYDTDSNFIVKRCIEILEKDNEDILFTSLNNGDIKTQFKNRIDYINFIKKNYYLDYPIISDLLSKPNIISKNGINYYIFEKKSITIQKSLEKKITRDDYNLICSKINDDCDIIDNTRDNILMLKDGKLYYPIITISKNKEVVNVKKKFIFNNDIQKIYDFHLLGCNKNTNIIFTSSDNYTCKTLNSKLRLLDKKYHIKKQFIDPRNKCRYILLNNNYLIPTYPSGTLYNIKIGQSINNYITDFKKSINILLEMDKYLDINFKPEGFLYIDEKNNKFNIVALMLENNIELRIKSEYISYNDIIKMVKNMGKREFKKKNVAEEDIINKYITSNEKILDDRVKNVKKNEYNKESYNLFRLEISNFIKVNSIFKEELLKILNEVSLKEKDKKIKIKELLLKYTNKELNNLLQDGGKKQENLIHLNTTDIKYEDYKIKNKRDICKTNKTKNTCNETNHCHWDNGKCLMYLKPDKLVLFINKITEEIVSDEMKSKELLSIDNYYVSDIVDYDKFTTKKNQKIIKSDVPNINKILSEIFGEDNIPTIGRRKNYKKETIKDTDISYPLEKIGNIYIQSIIMNNYSLLRAFSNSYYWLNNSIYDIKNRNLGYYSDLQTDLTNYFLGNIIDFASISTYFTSYISKYINISNYDYVQKITPSDTFYNNGFIEFLILSHLYKLQIVVNDNYYNPLYIIKNGDVIYNKSLNIKDNKYKKYLSETNLKKSIVILIEFNTNNKIINVRSIYY